MRRRRFSPLVLSAAITIAIGSTVAWSGTQEQSLLQRLSAGDKSARLELAQLYEAQNQRDRALDQLQQAAQEGSATAHLLLAGHLANSDTQDAWEQGKHHLAAAGTEEGASALSNRMGIIASIRAIDLERGESERKGYAKDAEHLLNNSAATGNADAKWHLGYLYVMGLSSRADPDIGMAMIEAAADLGHSVATHWLAKLYEGVALTGRPTVGMQVPALDVKPYAREQSFLYFQRAAALGNQLAAKELANLYAQGDAPGGVDLQRANRILATLDTSVTAPAAATLPVTDDPTANAPRMIRANLDWDAPATSGGAGPTVSVLPATGTEEEARLLEVIREREATIARLQRDLEAANAKIARLEAELAEVAKYRALQGGAGELNERGIRYYLAGDYESALPLFRQAAELDHSGAVANLALHYLNGRAVPQDLKQAQALLIRAAGMGNLVATENLAELYETGTGLMQDRSSAISWYRRAQSLGSAKAPAALQRLGAEPYP